MVFLCLYDLGSYGNVTRLLHVTASLWGEWERMLVLTLPFFVRILLLEIRQYQIIVVT